MLKLTILILFSVPILTQDDCIFNSDFKGLGEEWVDSLNLKTKFNYDSLTKRYTATLNHVGQVSLIIGGCSHFQKTATISFIDSTPFSNKLYWIAKAKELSSLLHMDFFTEKLGGVTAKNVKQRSEKLLTIEVELDEFQENLISDGVVIKRDSSGQIIVILSYYYN